MSLNNQPTSFETRGAVQLGFSIVLVLMLVYAFTSLYQLQESTSKLTKVVEINNTKVAMVYRMRDAVRQRQILLNLMLSSHDVFIREEKSHEFYRIGGEFRRAREKLESLPLNKIEQELIKQIVSQVHIAQPINDLAVQKMMAEEITTEAYNLIAEAQSSQVILMGLMDKLVELQVTYEREFVEDSRKGYKALFFWSVFSILTIAALAFFISRIVSNYVSQKNSQLLQKNAELEETSKLAHEATRTKSAFLATMSHEIRTPLTAIIGFAEACIEGDKTEKERIDYQRSIVRNGKHLLQVINDILDFSKFEAQRIEFEKEPFSPVEVLQEVMQTVSTQVKNKGLDIHLNFEYPVPAFITGDRLRFHQIVLNVVSNAIKFTDSGRISIKAACDEEYQLFMVEVIDTGIGMTEEQAEKIFEVFNQADSSTARKYGGTGLGLSLSREFARSMGGDIQAHSLLDVGSRFIISIGTGDLSSTNRIDSDEQLKSVSSNTPASKDFEIKKVKGSILLAEDNPDNQQLFTILITKTGADLTIVSNGRKAVEKALKQPYDLIFMDMQMPVLDGLEAIRELRAKAYQGPIVTLTANALKQDILRSEKAGSNGYITKPVNKETFYKTISKYLEVIETPVCDNKNINRSEHFFEHDPDVIVLQKKFIQSLPGRFDQLQKSFNNRDWQGANEVVHKLKGLGTSLGCPQVTEISLKIEDALREKAYSECEFRISELSKAIDNLVQLEVMHGN